MRLNRGLLRFAVRRFLHSRQTNREYWTRKLREAERELEAATTSTAINGAMKRLMLAKAELKRLEQKPAQASGAATQAATVEL